METFHRFQELCGKIAGVSERICRLRPVEDTLAPEAKKTALTIQAEITREIAAWAGRVFIERNKTGQTDLEALEVVLRSLLHRAGAAALTQLPRFAEPGADRREIPCACGHKARYRELRSRRIVTVLDEAELTRPPTTSARTVTTGGSRPTPVWMWTARTSLPACGECLPLSAVRRLSTGGRRQITILAGLEITTKAVERSAEAIGEDIGRRERKEVDRAMQLHLPIVVGEPVPVLYLVLILQSLL